MQQIPKKSHHPANGFPGFPYMNIFTLADLDV